MAAAPKPFYTPEQYLELERQAFCKSEYVSGHMVAMAGASFSHNLLVAAISREMGNRLARTSCRVVASDQRVRVSPTGLYTYPDVLVVCGQPQFTDDHLDTLTNPTVIVEVLSPSTQLYDRNEKFRHYEMLDMLRDYVLVAQDEIHVDHYTRQGERQWLLTRLTEAQEVLSIASLGCEIPLMAMYDGIMEHNGDDDTGSNTVG